MMQFAYRYVLSNYKTGPFSHWACGVLATLWVKMGFVNKLLTYQAAISLGENRQTPNIKGRVGYGHKKVVNSYG